MGERSSGPAGAVGQLLDLLRRVVEHAENDKRFLFPVIPGCKCESCALLCEAKAKLQEFGHGQSPDQREVRRG